MRKGLLAHAELAPQLLNAKPHAHLGVKLSHRHLLSTGVNDSGQPYISHTYISDNLKYNANIGALQPERNHGGYGDSESDGRHALIGLPQRLCIYRKTLWSRTPPGQATATSKEFAYRTLERRSYHANLSTPDIPRQRYGDSRRI